MRSNIGKRRETELRNRQKEESLLGRILLLGASLCPALTQRFALATRQRICDVSAFVLPISLRDVWERTFLDVHSSRSPSAASRLPFMMDNLEDLDLRGAYLLVQQMHTSDYP